MVAECILRNGDGSEGVALGGVELHHAKLHALGELKRLGVLVIPLPETGIVERDGFGLLFVLRETRDPDGEGIGDIRDGLLDLHRRSPRCGAAENGGRDLHHGETALEELLEALWRETVFAQKALIQGEAELPVLLERPVGADRLCHFRIRRLETIAAGHFNSSDVLPRLAIHLGVAATPVTVLAKAADILGYCAEFSGAYRLASELGKEYLEETDALREDLDRTINEVLMYRNNDTVDVVNRIYTLNKLTRTMKRTKRILEGTEDETPKPSAHPVKMTDLCP